MLTMLYGVVFLSCNFGTPGFDVGTPKKKIKTKLVFKLYKLSSDCFLIVI